MYRLTIFILLMCAISQQLVGAVRRSLVDETSGRNNIYFDSYDHESLEENEYRNGEESVESFRDAVLIQPEEVIDIPPVPVERDYDMSDISNESFRNDYMDDSVGNSKITRNFFDHLMDQIGSLLGFGHHTTIPTIPTTPPQNSTPVFHYSFDDSIDHAMREKLLKILDNIETKLCINAVEDPDKAEITFVGSANCVLEAGDNMIRIGWECFETRFITKIMLKKLEICSNMVPSLISRSLNPYAVHIGKKIREEEVDCVDKLDNCKVLAANGGCTKFFQILAPLCPRTCRVCGDYCIDYGSNCKTNNTMRDCAIHWRQKKLTCAKTCGVCDHSVRSTCVDKVPEWCPFLAQNGFCKKFPDVTKEVCALSCGYCVPDKCKDGSILCARLEGAGACAKMPKLMKEACPKTCNMCQHGDYQIDNHYNREECVLDKDFVVEYCNWT